MVSVQNLGAYGNYICVLKEYQHQPSNLILNVKNGPKEKENANN